MSWQPTIYRKCSCGETAFGARYDGESRTWTWRCRNCGTPARDRRGNVKVMTEHDRPGSSERGPG